MGHWRFVVACAVLALAGIAGSHSATASLQERTADLTVHYRVCDEAPADGNWYGTCHDSPEAGAYVAANSVDVPGAPLAAEGTTDDQGNVTLDVYAGTYTISVVSEAYSEVSNVSIFCSRDGAESVEIPFPVVIGTGDAVTCDYYVVPTSYAPDTLNFSIGAINCDADPGNYHPNSGQPIPEGCEPAVGVAFSVAQTDGAEIASCITDDTGGCTVDPQFDIQVVVTEDTTTLPAGYLPRENPIQTRNYTEFAGAYFINVLQSSDDGSGQDDEATEAAPADPEQEQDGRPAGLYAGTCDDLGDVVDNLAGLAVPEGDATGAEDALAVETSFTRLTLSLDDILAGDHAVAVFATDDPEAVVACGAVGGVVADDGSLAVGLREVDSSGYAGIAYLAPDDDETTLTIFLAEDLASDAATPEAD